MDGRDRRRATGFTLIEVLMVVLLLGLIAAIALPRMATSSEDANRTACRTNIVRINAAIELWTVGNGGDYPSGGGAGGGETKVSKISRYYVGVYPTDQSEFEAKVLNNPDVFPEGPPVCPYGQAYEYDPSTNRVKPHEH